MDKTGGWRRRAQIIGLWERLYLMRVNVLPGPFRHLAERLCNQQMCASGQRRALASARTREEKAKWLSKGAIHPNTDTHTGAVSSLTNFYRAARANAINCLSYQDAAGSRVVAEVRR